MLQWIDSHGIESMLIYVGFCLFAGTIPPLPDGANYFATWAYAIIKAASANSRGVGNAMGIKLPELQLTNLPGMKIKSDN